MSKAERNACGTDAPSNRRGVSLLLGRGAVLSFTSKSNLHDPACVSFQNRMNKSFMSSFRLSLTPSLFLGLIKYQSCLCNAAVTVSHRDKMSVMNMSITYLPKLDSVLENSLVSAPASFLFSDARS